MNMYDIFIMSILAQVLRLIDLARNLASAIEREDREAMERLMAEGYDSASDELLKLLQVRPCGGSQSGIHDLGRRFAAQARGRLAAR